MIFLFWQLLVLLLILSGGYIKKIISFGVIPVSATEENLVDIIVSCLLDWSIENICIFTIDNCSTNNVVARSLINHYEPRGYCCFEVGTFKCVVGHIS